MISGGAGAAAVSWLSNGEGAGLSTDLSEIAITIPLLLVVVGDSDKGRDDPTHIEGILAVGRCRTDLGTVGALGNQQHPAEADADATRQQDVPASHHAEIR